MLLSTLSSLSTHKKMEKNKKECENENEEKYYKNIEEEEKDDDVYDDGGDDVENENEKSEKEDENSDTDSENSTDNCDSSDEKEILKSLLLLNQFKKKKKEIKKNEFLPSLKTFFKASMKKKHKLYDSAIKNKIYFLAKNILSEKIPVDFSPEYRYILNRIVKRKMHSNDIKIALCEDYCLSGIFSKAIKLIEISQKNDKCK